MGRSLVVPMLAVLAGSCATDDAGDSPDQLAAIVPANTQQCGTTYVEGVDVYAGTGTVNWTNLKSSGRAFAFIKATQGTYDKQSTFLADWAGAGSAGIQRSAYHFFDPTDDGSAQAAAFLAELGSAGGMTDADLPPLLDIECPVAAGSATAKSEGSGCEYPGSDGWVATATMQQRIFDYLDAVEAAVHRKPIVYSYPSWFGDLMFTNTRLTSYPLFIATYSACASVPPPWTSAVFWQYSATGTVPGIAGSNNVDEDRFFGSAGDLATWNANTIERDAGVDAPPAEAGAGTDGGPDGDAGMDLAKGSGCGCASTGGDAPGGLLLAAFVIVGVRRRPRA